MTYGVGCTEVEVDCITGDVTVLSANIVMDVGKSINPAIGKYFLGPRRKTSLGFYSLKLTSYLV